MSDSDREELRTAHRLLGEAAAATDGEPADRLSGFADRVEGWAEGESDPDHGAMATVLLKLNDIADEAEADVADTVQEARSAITEYRRTVEGV
jgi:hypothetical protein